MFGSMVRKARENRGWSQAKLAQQMSEAGMTLHQTGVARLEAGDRPTRFNEVIALSKLLDLRLSTATFAPDKEATIEELEAAALRLEAIVHEAEAVRNQLTKVQQDEAVLQMRLGELEAGRHELVYWFAREKRYVEAFKASPTLRKALSARASYRKARSDG